MPIDREAKNIKINLYSFKKNGSKRYFDKQVRVLTLRFEPMRLPTFHEPIKVVWLLNFALLNHGSAYC